MTEKEFILEFVKRYKDCHKKVSGLLDVNQREAKNTICKAELLLFCKENQETMSDGFHIANMLVDLMTAGYNGRVSTLVRSWQLLIDG